MAAGAAFFLFSATLPSALAGEETPPLADPALSESETANAVDWLTGSGVSLGGFLFPHLHAFGAFGGTTGDAAEMAVGHHDPSRNAMLQSLEPSLSLRYGDYLEGFATYSFHTTEGGDLDGDLEEAFLKLKDLPFGLELRGGQFLNRFGFQNAVHNHGWMFVDQNLVNGRILQEGELMTMGGEVTWMIPTPWVSALSISAGGLPEHDHDHEHGHGEEAEFEGEGANYDAYLIGLNYLAKYDYNDFNQFSGTFSGAWGENEFGRNTSIYGIGFEYLWRENGYEPGGRSLRWRTEAMLRHIEAVSGELHEHEHGDDHEHEEEHEHGEEDHDDHDEHGEEHHEDEDHEHEDEERHYANFDEFGFSTSLIYGFNDFVETGVRAGWVSGIRDMGLDDRWRVSPMVTCYLNRERTVLFRLQYNYDQSNDFGGEHSVWAQIGINWGGPEVR